ncbi:hypothetical protein PTKIN_Ptkin06aG0115500 [Pterospermum kingtungense]
MLGHQWYNFMCLLDAGRVVDILDEHPSIEESQGTTNMEARIGRVAGNKDLYLGTFSTHAEAYDIPAIKFRGLNAITNFDTSRYDV